MKMQKIFLLLIILGSVIPGRLLARQASDSALLIAEMKKMQLAYQAHPVSFDIRYTYAGERQPDVIIDSLQGSVELAGSSSYYRLDNMETLSNSRYQVVLFKEDKVMYLTRPSVLTPADPLQQMQALLQKSGIKHCSIHINDGIKTLTVDFEEGMPCRQLVIHVDARSGYVSDMQYVVKTALMMESPGSITAAAVAEYGEYALVSTVFEHYRELPATGDRFNDHRFFYKAGEELKTTPAYAEYKIFQGSPNL
jgi:hypothetical protein